MEIWKNQRDEAREPLGHFLEIEFLDMALKSVCTKFEVSVYRLQIYTYTRIKATRCETLRTVTTNNSKKHSHLTYCLNISLMVQKGTATIFSTSEPILLIVHENDLF